MPLFEKFNSYMLLNLSNFHTALLNLSTKECVLPLLTNVLVAVFNFFSVPLNSSFESLSAVNRSIKGHFKKKQSKNCGELVNAF